MKTLTGHLKSSVVFLVAQNMWKSLTTTDSQLIHLTPMIIKWHIFKPVGINHHEQFICSVLCVVCPSSSCTQRPACPSMLCGSWPLQCAWSPPPCGRWWSRGMCCSTLLWRSLWLLPVRPSRGSWPPDIRASWPWGSGDGWVCATGSHQYQSLKTHRLQLLIESTGGIAFRLQV